MYQLNERVSALFNKTKNCTLSTNGEYPNTIVIMFKEINAQGEILLCDVFMNKNFPGCELAGTRFAAATYNVPKGNLQLPEVFVILTENRNQENGYTYFTCSMSTLERVFIDLVIQSES